jgi:hypothetical protein
MKQLTQVLLICLLASSILAAATATATTTDTGAAKTDASATDAKAEDTPATTEITSNSCKNLSYFEVQAAPNNGESGYCGVTDYRTGKQMNFNQCCPSEVVKKLNNWWYVANEPSTNERPPFFQRQDTLKMIANYTITLLNLITHIKKMARAITMNSNADNSCRIPANEVMLLKIPGTIVEDYIKETSNCWQWKNDLILSFMCSICDPAADSRIDISTNKAKFSKKTCSFFVDNCFHSIWMNHKYFRPVFEEFSRLSVCGKDGIKKSGAHEYFWGNPK